LVWGWGKKKGAKSSCLGGSTLCSGGRGVAPDGALQENLFQKLQREKGKSERKTQRKNTKEQSVAVFKLERGSRGCSPTSNQKGTRGGKME